MTKNNAVFLFGFPSAPNTAMCSLQFLARMAKEKIIDKREFKDFQDFVKRTEGEFDVINIPVEHKKGFDENAFVVREFADLKENGVRFYEMPDLNMEDNYVQLAVSREDKELFSAWYTRYLNNKMSRGGVKTVESLKAFTDGKVSIFSVPLEGKEEIFQEDFAALKVNYTVLPDLKVGDGQIQIMVANSDAAKVEQWYKLYQTDMLKKGKEIPDLNLIDMSTYQKTGEMSTDEYINTGDKKVAEANQKYEKSSTNKIPLAEEEKGYEFYEGNKLYQKITIDKATLVESLKKDDAVESQMIDTDKKGFFMSRIPGTYGKDVQYLLIPKECVFLSEDRKTYTAFLSKISKPMVFDGNLETVHVEDRLNTNELFRKHYDLSEKEQKATERAQRKVKKATGKTLPKKSVKAPAPSFVIFSILSMEESTPPFLTCSARSPRSATYSFCSSVGLMTIVL